MERVLYDDSFMLCGGGVSFVTSFVICRFLAPTLSRLMSPKYKNLPKSKVEEWNVRIMSNVNAVVSMSLSSYSLIVEPDMRNDVIWYDSKIARLACSIMIGYALADTVFMALWGDLSTREIVGYVFHHFATIYAYSIISLYGILGYFGMLRLLAEFSTPYVNQRWYFDTLGYPRSKLVVIVNGLMMLVSFFLCRIVTMPIYWYQIWRISGTDDAASLGYIQLVFYIPCLILDSLNIYWFHKICNGFLKALNNVLSKEVRTKHI